MNRPLSTIMGGIVPAAMVAFELDRPLSVLTINYRDDENAPRFVQPMILEEFDVPIDGGRILLVDDVSVSGKTLDVAKEALAGFQVATPVLKGQADIVLFPEVAACVRWPWKSS